MITFQVVVHSGDTLQSIAEHYLGSKDHWQEIYDQNRNVIGDNPDLILSNMVLTFKKPKQK